MITVDDQRGSVTDADDTATDDEHVCEACEESFESAAALERRLREVGLVD